MNGILYFLEGEACLDEAIRSIRSVRSSWPGLPIAAFSDQVLNDLVDELFPIPSGSNMACRRIAALYETPFKRTLYLDTDTLVLRHCEEIFEALGPTNRLLVRPSGAAYNCGVIGYHLDAGGALFRGWSDLQQHVTEQMDDEGTFAQALSSYPLASRLPRPYNRRPTDVGCATAIAHGFPQPPVVSFFDATI